jgi:urease accessory protein
MSKLRLFDGDPREVSLGGIATLTCIMLLASTQQAQAHHLMGGRLPANFFEGFMSGLAHPMIGLDHFAFIVAVGLLGATKRHGILLPCAFLFAALVGSGLHLMRFNIPGLELCVSASVLIFGILLAMKNSPNLWLMIVLGAIAGLFHGYAYAESIFGAETTPLVAYLGGFTFIQLVVAMGAWGVGKFVLNQLAENAALSLRFAGFVISGAGGVFLSSIVLNAIFPLPPTT